ncbi:MAG TPA: anti-sigma factor [Mycobacterium sp.]|nr:anti-sigma factor [Mycobacterium sp.]
MPDQIEGSDQPRSDRAVELRVAPRLENLAVVRMLVGAVGTFEDLDVDTVADLRLAIDELCTQLIRRALPDATLVVVIDPDDDKVVVRASTACRGFDLLAPGSFSWHVLKSLTDDAQAFHDGSENSGLDEIFGATLTTRRAGAER